MLCHFHSLSLLLSVVVSHAQEYQTLENRTYVLKGDMLLTLEQHSALRERSFITPVKWAKTGDEVVIPYYFEDSDTETSLERLINRAADEFYRVTCIKWMKVSSSDPRDKVFIFRGDKCYSSVGYVKYGNKLSLGTGCGKIGIVMHEMGHTMGLFHTQSRQDRDAYVDIWYDNIQRGTKYNFDIETSETYGVPYDYRSMMHYSGTSFSKNQGFTITSKNPYYQFVMGDRTLELIFTDKALLNIAYECPKSYESICEKKKCQNGGFLNKNCKCECPENTEGHMCEQVIEFFYSKQPECGGNITSPQTIQSDNYPGPSTRKTCIYWIKASTCEVPEITVTFAKFYGASCMRSLFAVKYKKETFDDYYCNSDYLQGGKVFRGESSEAVIYYFNNYEQISNYGFEAKVNFVPDKSCEPVTTTTEVPVEPPNIDKTGPCELNKTGPNAYRYTSPNYPSLVKKGVTCELQFSPSTLTSLVFFSAWVSQYFERDDKIVLKDPFREQKFTVESSENVGFAIWPFRLRYDSLDGYGQGEGFEIDFEVPQMLPEICRGKVIEVVEKIWTPVSNPLMAKKYSHHKGDPCVFMFKAPMGKRVQITSSGTNSLKTSETLGYTKDFPKSYELTYFTRYMEVAETKDEYALIYYKGSSEYDYTDWMLYGEAI